MQARINRRSFLRRTAAVALPCIVPSAALGLAGTVAPSNRIAMGFIGCGGRGSDGLRTFMGQDDVQVVAVCDVSTDNSWRTYPPGGLEPAMRTAHLAPANAYRDFRELLARDDIDAVQIATGERWHPLIAAAAVRAGKDVYCEKPLALNVADGKALRAVCQRYGAVFQLGTQQRSSHNFRFACELVRNGRIGRLHTIKVGVVGSKSGGLANPQPVPRQLDYDLWTGPSIMRPFAPGIVSEGWNFISDYALGFIHNWGIHHLDIAQWGNGSELTGPLEIAGKGIFPKVGLLDTLTAWDVEMVYANGVRMIYTDNASKEDWQSSSTNDARWDFQQAGKNPKNPQGIRFEGTEGWVFVTRGELDAHPKSLLNEKIGANEIRLPVSALHERNFLDCVKSRAITISPIEVAVRSDMLCHLANLAVRLDRPLKWEPARELFAGDDEANRLLSIAHREPWTI